MCAVLMSVSGIHQYWEIYQYRQKYRLTEYIGIGWTHIGPTLIKSMSILNIIFIQTNEFSSKLLDNSSVLYGQNNKPNRSWLSDPRSKQVLHNGNITFLSCWKAELSS